MIYFNSLLYELFRYSIKFPFLSMMTQLRLLFHFWELYFAQQQPPLDCVIHSAQCSVIIFFSFIPRLHNFHHLLYEWVCRVSSFMAITKPCNHLHPARSNSTQLHAAHFSHQPVLYNTLNNIIRTKISHVIQQFPHIQA